MNTPQIIPPALGLVLGVADGFVAHSDENAQRTSFMSQHVTWARTAGLITGIVLDLFGPGRVSETMIVTYTTLMASDGVRHVAGG